MGRLKTIYRRTFAAVLAVAMVMTSVSVPGAAKKAKAAEAVLTFGSYDRASQTFKDATGSSDESVKYKSIVISYTLSKLDDSENIELPTVSGYTYNSSISGDYSKIINVNDTDGKTAKEIAEEYIRKIQFNGGEGGQSVNVSLSTETILYKTFYWGGNGHYYQYVPFKYVCREENTWAASYDNAKKMTYSGRKGYLATVTSKEEDMFIKEASASIGWLGGTRLQAQSSVDLKDSAVTFEQAYGTSVSGGAYWYWACGPEAGNHFYDVQSVTNQDYQTKDQENEAKGYYFNWERSGPDEFGYEPNNTNNTENALTTLQLGEGSYGVGTPDVKNYSWNDLAYNDTGTNRRYAPGGFFVEYGDQLNGDSSDSSTSSSTSSASATAGIAGIFPQWLKDAGVTEEDVTYDARAYQLTFDKDVTLTDSIILPAGKKELTIDLNGNTVTGSSGKPVIKASSDTKKLQIENKNGNGSIVGCDSDEAGSDGATAIDMSATSSATLNIEGNVSISGGNGADNTEENGTGGNGGDAITGGSNLTVNISGTTNPAKITGGNGGNASGKNGTGGNGGAGISGSNTTITVGADASKLTDITGGNGGDALGSDGIGGNGGNGVQGTNVTVNTDSSVKAGNGGNGTKTAGQGGNSLVDPSGDPKQDSVKGEDGKAHTHQWVYCADPSAENTILAYCDASDYKCSYYGRENAGKLVLEAEDMEYSGNAYDKMEIKNEISLSDPTVTCTFYKAKEKESTELDGAALASAPTDAGDYVVVCTVTKDGAQGSGAQAKVAFSIVKLKQKATVVMSDYTYGSTVATPSVSGVKEITGEAGIEWYYTTENTAANGKKWENIEKDTLEPDTYYMYAVIPETANYEKTVTDTVSFKVIGSDMTGITAPDVEKVYDGNRYGISVSGAPEGAVITYGTEAGVYKLSESPSYKDVKMSGDQIDAYTIYYEVKAKGYNPYQGHATVKILQKEITGIEWDEDTLTLTYNGTEQAPKAKATGLVTGDKCTVTVGGAQANVNAADDKYTATVTGLGNTNYKLPDTLQAAVEYTITPATLINGIKIAVADTCIKYTGADVTQTIAKVTLNGKDLVLGTDYEIDTDNSVLTAKDIGKYTITIKGKGNYKDSAVVQWYITEEDGHIWPSEWTTTEEATASKEGRKEMTCLVEGCECKRIQSIPMVGSEDEKLGNLQKYTELQDKAVISEASVENTKQELLSSEKLFTADEKTSIETDTSAKVWLQIANTDVDNLSASDRTMVQAEADKVVGQNAELTYFDADLYKKIGNNAAQQIYEPGVKIKVSIRIPDELLNHAASMIREYKIIRLHKDQTTSASSVDVLSGTFTESTSMFTFETDRFSTYAIAYKDTPKKSPSYPVIVVSPTPSATTEPSEQPSASPTGVPTVEPSTQPTVAPTAEPSTQPTETPSAQPDTKPQVKDQSKLSASEVASLKLPILLATGKGGNHKITVSWSKYTGAAGYDCFWSYCDGKKNFKKFAKLTNGKCSVTQKNRKNSQHYKYFIAAYKLVDGKKVYIAKSNQLHVAMKGNKRTNAVSISVNKAKLSVKSGQTFTVKAKTKLENSKKKQLLHAKAYRYYSTNKKVAVVSKSGKITAKSKGACTIIVLANNGVYKKIAVKVK